jgi:hypothetical protein
MNELREYVRDYILDHARAYAGGDDRTPESTESAFRDALQGTDSGWWHQLIYTADVLDLSHRYRRDIAQALAEYRDETGESYVYRDRWHGPADETTAEDILEALLSGPFSFDEYHGESARGRMAEAACLGLRFAVEWYAGEVAREYCPDL